MHRCFICKGNKFTTCFHKFGGMYYKCRQCGLLRSSLIQDAEQSHASLYFDKGELDLAKREYCKKNQKEYSAEILSYTRCRQMNRLLDIGCGTGGFLFNAKKSGWEGVGTEVSSHAAKEASEKGIEVHLGALKDLDFENGSFDLIRMGNVIEHINDPLGDILTCHRLLRAGGQLVLSTVNTDSFTYRLMKERWRYIDPRYHIHLFTHKNILLLLKNSGFDILSLKTMGVRTLVDNKFERLFLVPLLKLPAKILHKGHRMHIVALKK